MCREKGFIVKSDVPDNAKPVSKDAEFEGIAEMAIDVHLLNGRIGGGMGRHGAVSGLVGIIGVREPFCLFEGFELSDDTVGILGIVFGAPGFNAGGIKEHHGGFFRVNALADRLGQIDEMVEHGL